MNKFLDGKKTYIGLIVTLAGFLGIGKILGNENISQLLDVLFQALGLIYAMYGNYKAHAKIKDLQENS